VADWKVSIDVHGVCSCLGLANYFQRILQGYSKIVGFSTNFTRKDRRWIWTQECQEAFEKVKHAMINTPVLAPPKLGKPFEMVSAVLLQDGRPVAFESRSGLCQLIDRNYTVTKQKMLGVTHALKTWKCYLEGSHFVVVTDHCPNIL
jgi:hypothetical protein